VAVVVAIDAGTTGVRSLAVDESGTIIDVAYRELAQYFPRPGWVEHDPDEIWAHVRATLAELLGRLDGQPAALGITNQRETVVAWDRSSGQSLHRAIVWLDRRTARRCEELQEEGHLGSIRRTTGLVLDPYFSATKMEWLLAEGRLAEVPAERLALGTVDSWLLWQLTGGASGGGVFATDCSNASRTLLFDIGRLCWSEELCDLFGIPSAVLPEARPTAGRFGVVSADVGIGPLNGVPISGIAGDQQAALFGQACFEPGMTKATYGTGSFVLLNVGSRCPQPVDGLLTTLAWDLGALTGGPTYALEGSTFVSGAAIQWLRDQLGVIARAEEIGPLAGSVPDSGGVSFVPAFSGLGSPWWDARARGAIIGLTRGAGRAQLARAVVESIAFSVRAMVETMGAGGTPPAVLRADGGAAAMDLLLQLQADQLGVPVARPRSVESTALGAAMLAGLAEGVWGSLDELASLWRLDAEFTRSVDPALGDAQYAAWRRAVERATGWA
jgi:glycerol kinase